MDSRVQTLCDLKSVKLLMEKNPDIDVNSLVIRKFLHGSKNFLSEYEDEMASDELCEWYSVLTSVLQAVQRYFRDCPGCASTHLELVLSVLNHILYYLIKLEKISTEWLSYLGNVTLEFLTHYSRLESHKDDFAVAIAQKSYSFLCSVGQTLLKETKEHKRCLGDGYLLCLLGCAFSNLNTSKTEQTAPHMIRNFLSNYNQLSQPGERSQILSKIDLQQRTAICRSALIVYCTRPCSLDDNDCLLFVEIFRLAMNCPELLQRFLDCDGNLFQMDLAKGGNFPCKEIKLLQRRMEMKSQDDLNRNRNKLEVTLSICHFIGCVKGVDANVQKAVRENITKTSKMADHIQELLGHVQHLVTQHQCPITKAPKLFVESLSLLVTNSPDIPSMPTTTLLAYDRLISLCIEFFARDTLAVASSSKLIKGHAISRHTYTLAVFNKNKMQVLQELFARDNLNDYDLPLLASALKSSLNSLCMLAQSTKKKGLLSPELSAYRQIFKTLNNAFTSIGNIGRQLRRLEKHDAIIVLLSPLWPISSIPELVLSLSHQESLCEAYRVTGDTTAACNVIAQAACIDPSLVTSSLFKSLVKMGKADPDVHIMSLFSRCEDQGLDLLIRYIKIISSNRSSMNLMKHLRTLLQQLASSSLLSGCNEAVVNFLLGDSSWSIHSAAEEKDKPELIKEALELLQKAVKWFKTAETSHGDLLAQALFMEAEIRHTLACLSQTDLDNCTCEPNVEDESSDANSMFDAMPGLLSNVPLDIAPQTPSGGEPSTPKIGASFQTPATAQARPTAKIKPRKLNMDKALTEGDTGKASVSACDSDLIGKAHSCFLLWKAWFEGFSLHTYNSSPLQGEREEGSFRLERSLGFLQRLSHVAVVNHQPVFAIDCVSLIHVLTGAVEGPNSLPHVKMRLLSLITKLGLVSCTGSEVGTKENSKRGAQDKDATDMVTSLEGELAKTSDRGTQDEWINPTPLASYFYSANEIGKCLDTLNTVMKHFEELKQKGPFTPSLSLSFVEMKRLSAEISSSPGGEETFKAFGYQVPYPLEAIAEAVKYMTSVAVFAMGADFKKASGRAMYVNSWQLIHDYLSTVSLCSRLFLEAGNIKYARTYLLEGLKVSHSCLLESWRGTFLSALADLSLHGFDSISEAQKFTKNGFEAVTNVTSVLQAEELSPSNGPVEEDVLNDLLLSIEEDGWDAGDEKCGTDCEMCSLQPQPQPNFFNSVVMEASIQLLWTEAELALQKDRDKSRALQLLQSAVKLSSHLSKFTVHKSVNALTDIVDANTSFNHKNANIYKLLLLETILKMSQVCFQALFLAMNQREGKGTLHFNVEHKKEVLNIHRLCGAILSMGKTLGSIGKVRIIMASAQLLQIQLNYFPCWYKESYVYLNGEEDVDEDNGLYESAKDLAIEEDYWNKERLRKLNLEYLSQPEITPKAGFCRGTCMRGSFKQKPSFAQRQGGGSKEHWERTPFSGEVSQVPTPKHRSPLADAGNESTSPAKSPKKLNSQRPNSKQPEVVTMTIQSEKSGSRTAGRARQQPRPMPILSISRSHVIYTETEEDDKIQIKATAKKGAVEINPKSQKRVKATGKRQKGAAVKEQSSCTGSQTGEDEEVKVEGSASELSPLSRELAQLNIGTSREEANRATKVRSKRSMCNPVDDSNCVGDENKTEKKPNRGRKATRTKNTDGRHAPLTEVQVSSSIEEMTDKETSNRKNADRDADCVVAASDVRNQTRRTRHAGKNDVVEPNNTRQRRRRRLSPEVDSPEKKRELDFQCEAGNIRFSLESAMLPHKFIASPVLSSSDSHTDNAETHELWSDEESVKGTLLCSKPISSQYCYELLDISVDPISPLAADKTIEAFHSSVKQNLLSPVEIPRGRPRRVKNNGEEIPAGSDIPPFVSKGKKKKSPVRKTKRKSIEAARGLDDEDKENICTPERSNDSVTFDPSSQGTRSRRTGTSKLSLRKKKPANDKSSIAGEQLNQANRSLSSAKDGTGSGEGKQSTPNSLTDGVDGSICMEEDHSVKSQKSCKSVRGQNNDRDGTVHLKPVKKGRKKEVVHSVEEGEEQELKTTGERCCNDNTACGSVSDEDIFETSSNPDEGFRMAAKFLTAPQDEPLEKDLRESIAAMKAFPPSYLYSQLSRWLAMYHWDRSVRLQDGEHMEKGIPGIQTSIAALLTDSLHVSFHHMLTRNLHHKLRRCGYNSNLPDNSQRPKKSGKKEKQCQWSDLNREEVESEISVLRQVLDMGQRDERVEKAFETRLQNIPEDWTVVQMSLLNFDVRNNQGVQILITRMSSDLQPLTVGIPVDRWRHFKHLMRVFKTLIKYDIPDDDPEQYWTGRYKRNQHLKELVYLLQEQFLCGHKWLLCGRPKFLNEKIQVVLDKAVKRTQEGLGEYAVDVKAVRVVLEVLLTANEKDIDSVLQSLWPPYVAKIVASSVWQVQMEISRLEPEAYGQTTERKPVILLLDKLFNQLPWESMPILSEDTVTRVPSLGALESLLTLHRQRPDSPFQTGVGRRNVVAVIDPETNLQNSVAVLKPQFEKYKGWTCVTQQAPTIADLKSFLSHQLYIFNGHGWGRKFVGGDELQMFRARAVAIIMGCHSGKMEFKSRTDGDGAPLYFLLAGCPTVLGNLWLVTDKDIDRLTSFMMSYWMSSESPTSLSHILNQGRKVCKLQCLTGFAPVIYGLPVTMN